MRAIRMTIRPGGARHADTRGVAAADDRGVSRGTLSARRARMNDKRSLLIAVALSVVALSAGSAVAADVDINSGWPPPTILKKPAVVAVPETKVYRAASLEFNVFGF